MRESRVLVIVFAVAVVLATSGAVGAATFQGLGYFPGGYMSESRAYDVSADGSTVVGYSISSSGPSAFRWTASDGLVNLGQPSGGSMEAYGHAVSGNGSTIVGQYYSRSFDSLAFRWTSSGGMVSLGDLAGGGVGSTATSVSADGSVVVGQGTSASGMEAFRWTAAGGMVGLGDLAGSSFGSYAQDVSADGSVVVGFGNSTASGESGTEAFRWTAGGMVGLGDLAGGSFCSRATSVSADGSVVAGFGTSASGVRAFRWTASGGMVDLGSSIGSSDVLISPDGSVVVGSNSQGAFLWTQGLGMQSLTSLLGSALPTGWNSLSVSGVTVNDGVATIVGAGRTGLGNTQAFVATVAVPEPGSLLALASGLLLVIPALRRRK